MIFKKLLLKGAYLITLEPHCDNRGSFTRLFCQRELKAIGFNKKIVQINLSFSPKKGTLRGLHYQKPPYSEVKIVTCPQGKIYDCIVDLRKESPTFLKWYGVILSDKNHQMLLVPEGFAHGFVTLSDNCQVLYFNSNYYKSRTEGGVRFDDPVIGIKWKNPIKYVSPKDQEHPLLKDIFLGLRI